MPNFKQVAAILLTFIVSTVCSAQDNVPPLKLEGMGSQQTITFTTKDFWSITIKSTNVALVFVYDAETGNLIDSVVDEQVIPRSGSFFLMVNSAGGWEIMIDSIPDPISLLQLNSIHDSKVEIIDGLSIMPTDFTWNDGNKDIQFIRLEDTSTTEYQFLRYRFEEYLESGMFSLYVKKEPNYTGDTANIRIRFVGLTEAEEIKIDLFNAKNGEFRDISDSHISRSIIVEDLGEVWKISLTGKAERNHNTTFIMIYPAHEGSPTNTGYLIIGGATFSK